MKNKRNGLESHGQSGLKKTTSLVMWHPRGTNPSMKIISPKSAFGSKNMILDSVPNRQHGCMLSVDHNILFFTSIHGMVLFDLILYVPVNNFSVMSDRWVRFFSWALSVRTLNVSKVRSAKIIFSKLYNDLKFFKRTFDDRSLRMYD